MGASGACMVAAIFLGSLPDAAADPCADVVAVHAEGRASGRVCAAAAPARRLTVLDLSDEFVPRALRAEPGSALPHAVVYRALAAESWQQAPAEASVDRYLELWGVFPNLGVLRARLADDERHLCHDRVDDDGLAGYRVTLRGENRTPRRQRRWEARRDAIRGLQEHLACDGLLPADGVDLRYGPRTVNAVALFQRRHMVIGTGELDRETRQLLVTDSRELDFRALLRALRERVVDATGLIEDGSALGEWGAVLDRNIEPDSLRDSSGLPPPARGAPDLISPATEAAARALGWTDPQAARASLDRLQRARTRQVAVRLPPPPHYHGPSTALWVEIDRGDVWYDWPWDEAGQRRAQPRERRPSMTLYAGDGARGAIALVRWPTTIGTWQREKQDDGGVVTVYKSSPPGDYQWREIISAPSWFAPPTTPDRELVRATPRGWQPREDAIGPGYRSAYGLVAIMQRTERGNDVGVRAHGTVDYEAVARGDGSHGCHRLFTHQALRLAGFLLTRRPFITRGQKQERFRRQVVWRERSVEIRRNTRGYVRELDPPVPVRVLEGRVLGSAREPIREPQVRPGDEDQVAESQPGAPLDQ
jgi:peptidoglycan hydrolase-like protein with peptidoglycan-binding domain